ncbi:CLUMA_CG000051, isoform A [Clunio marinus]|uniref:CLUMA_CG000051, isoform A n=1 Tax=Clunio marinus TaxID=568069 RepID=A0A1J1HFD8_9DIPT|nr:CLUMA_CG000051, isoform A [Clunio marinus]
MASNSNNHRGTSGGIQIGSAWFQRKINLRPQHRGVHLVTEEILRQMPEIGQFSVGLCHVQILHTSASLALNESWDPDVRDDMEMMLNKIVPEGLPYRHSCEGPDDMPAHVKACFLGSSLTIPITDGKLSLGTWQGVWLCEHRDHAGSRKLVITLSGCPRDSARSPLSPVSPIASTSS